MGKKLGSRDHQRKDVERDGKIDGICEKVSAVIPDGEISKYADILQGMHAIS